MSQGIGEWRTVRSRAAGELSGDGPQMPRAGVGEWITPVGRAVSGWNVAFQCWWWGQGGKACCPFPTSLLPVKLRQEAGPQSHFP